MQTPRRSRTGRSHRPRHSTGGLLGSRPARVVAAGLTVSVAVVGGVVVAERTGERPERGQAQPAPSRTAVAAPSIPAPSAPAPTPVAVTPPAVTDVPPVPPAVPDAPQETVVSRSAGRDPDPVRVPAPAPADPVRSPVAAPAPPPAPAPVPAPAPAPAPVQSPVEVPVAPAPTELELLSATLEIPEAWQVPRREVTIHVPGPEPVQVTGEVSSPEPGRVDVEVTLTPAPRHLAEDPAPETDDDVHAAQDHLARHLPGDPVG
ncbi:hypothetical protein [Kineococcus sp. SYSU DK001]|uniref:hypothetical protein n=1 Tax=Kineococcus sp. SYSU DK001 TaxID=3383122 RepID=UPI003D7D5413